RRSPMPDQLTHLLDQIDQLDQQATKGPWHPEYSVNTQSGWLDGRVYSEHDGESVTAEVGDNDAELIAVARTALPALAQAVRAVLDSCEEAVNDVLKQYSPDDHDRGREGHACDILDLLQDALGTK